MAIHTPGAGGTLKSTSIEAAFHEALSLVALAEQDPTKNPQNLTRLSLGLNLRTSQITGSFSFTVEPLVAADGATTFPVIEYLSVGYVTGSGGTLKSAGLCSAVVELAELMQAKQRLLSKNPTGLFAVRKLDYNSEAKFVSGFFDYFVTGAVTTSGIFSATAKTFLLD